MGGLISGSIVAGADRAEDFPVASGDETGVREQRFAQAVGDVGAGPMLFDGPPVDPPGEEDHFVADPKAPRGRPFARGVLLAVLTLGLYGLWWHRVVHKELCVYLRRPDEKRAIWSFYVVCHLVVWAGVVFFLVLSLVPLAYAEDAGPGTLLPGSVMLPVGLLIPVAGITGLVLYIIYVRHQIRWLAEAKKRLGLPMRTTHGRFFGVYFAAFVIQALAPAFGPIGMVVQPVAYWFLQQDYNDVHKGALKHQAAAKSPTAIRYAG